MDGTESLQEPKQFWGTKAKSQSLLHTDLAQPHVLRQHRGLPVWLAE